MTTPRYDPSPSRLRRDTSPWRGRQEERLFFVRSPPWLPLEGELSAKPTERGPIFSSYVMRGRCKKYCYFLRKRASLSGAEASSER